MDVYSLRSNISYLVLDKRIWRRKQIHFLCKTNFHNEILFRETETDLGERVSLETHFPAFSRFFVSNMSGHPLRDIKNTSGNREDFKRENSGLCWQDYFVFFFMRLWSFLGIEKIWSTQSTYRSSMTINTRSSLNSIISRQKIKRKQITIKLGISYKVNQKEYCWQDRIKLIIEARIVGQEERCVRK